jgi:hypothetical protein
MALSQADLDNLDAAIAMSELKVEFDGKLVIYRSVAELKEARAHVATVIASGGAGSPARRTGAYRFSFSTSRGD